MKKFLKIFLGIILIIYALAVAFYGYLNLGSVEPAKDITWGITFSHRHAEQKGLDWQEAYIALLDEAGVRNVRIPIYWDQLQPDLNKQQYTFDAWDWQIEELHKRGGKATLVVGYKLPRWPECFSPKGYEDADPLLQSQRMFQMLRTVVLHYRDHPALTRWQVENEYTVPFGICPSKDKDLFAMEIQLVSELDTNHQVMTTDAGQGSFWIKNAGNVDVLGASVYRFIEQPLIGVTQYPFSPMFYHRKKQIAKQFNPDVKFIIAEFQAEPWPTTGTVEGDYETMDPQRFNEHIQYAKDTGFDEIYLWGAEWWVWLHTQGETEIWEEVKDLF